MIKALIFIFLSCLWSTSYAQASLSELITPLTKKASVSIIIQDTISGQVLYSKNPEYYMMPASTQKILTAVSAKKQLNQQSPFVTDIWVYGDIKDKILHGDVVIKGTGDPALNSDKLNTLISKLKQQGINKINGDVILIHSHFDDRTHIPGTYPEEQDDCYCAQASSLSLDNNCYYVHLRPSDNKVNIISERNEALQSNINILDNCEDEQTPSIHHTLYGKGMRVDHYPYHTKRTLGGCWAKTNKKQQRLALSTTSPAKYFQKQTNKLIKSNHITAPFPKLKSHYHPNKNNIWHYQLNSEPLSHYLNKMLIKSSNFIANQLAKRMAALAYGEPASWEHSEQVFYKALAAYHVDEEASFADGSGVSRNNRIQVQHLASALQDIYHNPKLRSLLDGLNCISLEQEGNLPVCYKTGYIRGVIGRAGYINPRGQRPKTVVILINGSKAVDKLFEEQETAIFAAIANNRY